MESTACAHVPDRLQWDDEDAKNERGLEGRRTAACESTSPEQDEHLQVIERCRCCSEMRECWYINHTIPHINHRLWYMSSCW